MEVANPVEAQRHASPPDRETDSRALQVRNALPEDAPTVASVLARAFPALYRSTFGTLEKSQIISLLQTLYEVGHLPLEDTRVCVVDGAVAGVMILHTGRPIGRGDALAFWRLLRSRVGLLLAPRVYIGGILANFLLSRRIPVEPDLVYIEALAVAEPHRGTGVGTRLLADAEAWTRSRGRTRLALHVMANNPGARRLYQRVGFRPWHEREPYVQKQATLPPNSWSAMLMIRELTK